MTDRAGAGIGPPGRRAWWLLPEIVVFVILAALAVPYLGAQSAQSGLYAVAAERGARLLEQLSPGEHHNHGHEVTSEDRMFCGIHTFGVDPPGATVIDEVRTVYGYYFCAVGRPGTPYLLSSRSDGPIVVHLAPNPTVLIAHSGPGWRERVQEMMPDQYEPFCFSGLPDDRVAADVRRRYEAELL